MPLKNIIFILFLLYSSVGQALVYTDNITSNKEDSGDLTWNLYDNKIYPPLEIANYNDGVVQDRDFDVGDGQHGAFNSSTYARFSESGDVSGNIIRINTDTFSNLQFTVFTLDAGWTIRPTGSNPLIIRSQSTITISGTINCSGEDGEDGSNDYTTVNSGGQAYCGGGAGGNGGTVSTAATNGADGGAGTTGGGAGPNTFPTQGQGGGGGGSYTETGLGRDPVDGDDSLGGAGGSAGTIFTDHDFTVIAGGSGGGGGSHFDNGVDPNNSSGAGGGAGGGSVILIAQGDIVINAGAAVTADGGDGGSLVSPLEAGAGGGGGGGSIMMFTPADIIIDGTVSANEGAAGTTDGGDGGKGGEGRTWVVDSDGVAGGGMIEDPVTLLIVAGVAQYKIGTFTGVSTAIDSGNTEANFTSSSLTTTINGASSISLGVSTGGSANFSPSVFEDPASFTQTPNRYFRYQVSIDNQDAAAASTLDAFSLSFDGNTEEEFDFVGACGYVTNTKPRPPLSLWILLLLPFIFNLIMRLPRASYK